MPHIKKPWVVTVQANSPKEAIAATTSYQAPGGKKIKTTAKKATNFYNVTMIIDFGPEKKIPKQK